MLSDQELLKLLLPEFLVEHFDILKAETHDAELHLYFEEKSSIPHEFKERQLESKGFLPEIIIDDYPLRGKIVKLHVKRRRWTDKSFGEILQRDWQLVAKGTRMTKDLAGFLKKISRH
ncbi:transposase [Chryseobacterium sp. C3]|uniref:ISAon1 family transposase N-terminal region protein n=1 Tax=Chryseobacterium sp. C3 TaxID=2761532 RepID=UPI001625C654|nr:transposase [Chryseobacterium sp. C3]